MNQLEKHGICDMCEKDVYRPWTDHHGRKLCCDCVIIAVQEPMVHECPKCGRVDDTGLADELAAGRIRCGYCGKTFDVKRPPIIDELRALERQVGCEVGIQPGLSFRIVGKYEDGRQVLKWLHDHGAQLQRVGPYTDANIQPRVDPTRFLFYGFLADPPEDVIALVGKCRERGLIPDDLIRAADQIGSLTADNAIARLIQELLMESAAHLSETYTNA